MSNESETWMQIMCKAACPHHQELQPNWLFDQNRVRNRYSSILQLHNGSADMIAKTSLCAKTVSLFAKQTTRLSMCNRDNLTKNVQASPPPARFGKTTGSNPKVPLKIFLYWSDCENTNCWPKSQHRTNIQELKCLPPSPFTL